MLHTQVVVDLLLELAIRMNLVEHVSISPGHRRSAMARE
jgi:hypothetical protein